MRPRRLNSTRPRLSPRKWMAGMAVALVAYGSVALLREHRSYGFYMIALGLLWGALAYLWNDDKRAD